MFFGVGFKEHLVVVESAPYGDSMFSGTIEVLSVSSDRRLAMLMGNKAQVEFAMQTWEAEVEAGKEVELGELFLKANVAMLMDNAWKPLLRAPALFIGENEQVKCIPCDEDKPYLLCVPGDETHHTMQELSRAVQDYDKNPTMPYSAITENIARFILTSFNLPSSAVIRYLNFKEGISLAVSNGTSTTH